MKDRQQLEYWLLGTVNLGPDNLKGVKKGDRVLVEIGGKQLVLLVIEDSKLWIEIEKG